MAGSSDTQQVLPFGLLTPDANANPHDRRAIFFDGAKLVLEVPGASGAGRLVEIRRKSVAGVPATTAVGGFQFNGNVEVPAAGGLATSTSATDTIVLAPNGVTAFDVIGVANAVDNIRLTPAATANPATVDVSAVGTDANIHVSLTPKGTGTIVAKGNLDVSTKNILTDATTGTQIATAVTQKLGLYGATPIVQRSGAAQAAVATTASTATTPYGYTTAAQADGIVTLLNELRAALVALGAIKGAA